MLDSFTLSNEAADILAEDLDLRLRQFPFEFPYFAATMDKRASLRKEVWSRLEEKRLAEHGQVEPEVEQALNLLHQSELAVAITYFDRKSDELYRARLAVGRRSAVLAVQETRGLRVRFVDVRGLARVCVDALPEAPAGRLEGGTVPGEQTSRPSRSGEPDSWLSEARPGASGGGAEQRKVRRILELPVTRIGYLIVNGHAPDDGRPVALPPITFRDTEEGRYSLTTRENHDHTNWTTIAPADKPRLARALEEQLAKFRSR